MSSTKALKSRIKSIQNTRQITKAMELVAASRLSSVQDRALRAEPFFTAVKSTMQDIAMSNRDFSSPFCTSDTHGSTCHIVIAGDRGLAGGYNSNLFKSVNLKKDDLILPIGKKAIEHFTNKNILTTDYTNASNMDISDCYTLGKRLCDLFLQGEFISLNINYTKFINIITQKATTNRILPLSYDNKSQRRQIIFEPSAEEAFASIVPLYVGGVLYGALTSSIASEICARRNAMHSANKNADEMISQLNLEYNRARQASITQELTEIVAGTNNEVK